MVWLAVISLLLSLLAWTGLVWLVWQVRQEFIRFSAEIDTLKTRIVDQDLAQLSLRGALSALSEDARAVSEQQELLESRVRHVAERQDQLALREPETEAYRHAVRLASEGATPEELMEKCGLARGEIDLLLSLQAGSAPPPK